MSTLIPEIATHYEPQLSGLDNLLDQTTKNIKGSVAHGLVMQTGVASSNERLNNVYLQNKTAIDAYFGEINMAKVWQLAGQNEAIKQKLENHKYTWLFGGFIAGYALSKWIKK